MGNIGRAALQSGSRTGVLNNQMRAFGTTLRYAFAGSVIFGAARLVTTLQDIQRQLALIGAIGGFFEEQPFDQAQKSLDNLYNSAVGGSIRAQTPVNEFNEALINLYSTVQGLDANNAVAMTTRISQGAQLAQISAEEMTRTVAGMNQAFGGEHNLRNYERFVRGFFELTSQAPGGVAFGPQFVQQLPQLAAVSRLARISPEQMYGLYLTTLRTGGSPATAGRGLQYLLQSIAVPASDQSRTALARAGISPTTVQQKGGQWALEQLMAYARNLGVSGNLGQAGRTPDEVLDALEGSTPAQMGAGLGVSGRGLDWMSQAIGRIHGVRALVALMAQEQSAKHMSRDQQIMASAMADTEQAQKLFADNWADFARAQPLKSAQVSLDLMRRSIARSFEFAINPAARGISWLGLQAQQHPEGAERVAQGGAAFLALLGITKLVGGRIPGGGLLGRLGGLGGAAGHGFAMANAAQAAVSGQTGPGLSPQNPLYVVVVTQLFNKGGNTLGPGGRTPPVAPVPTGGGGRGGRFGRLGRFAKGGLGAAAALAGFEMLINPPEWIRQNLYPGYQGIFEPGYGDQYLKGDKWNIGKLFGGSRQRGPLAMSVLTQRRHAQEAQEMRQQRLRNVNDIYHRYNPRQGVITGITSQQQQRIEGKAYVVMDVNIRRDGKTITKRVKIPLDLMPTGGRIPSARGQSRTNRRTTARTDGP